MRYMLGYKESIIKSDDNVYIKETNGATRRAMLVLSNRYLVVIYSDDNDDDVLKIFPIEFIYTVNGHAQINSGGGNQPFFEIYFPDTNLYVFFGHSVRRGWQIQAEGRVNQWISSINLAVERYKLSDNGDRTLYSAVRNQHSDNRKYSENTNQVKKPNFCPGCGSPLSQEDVFCVACGRRV